MTQTAAFASVIIKPNLRMWCSPLVVPDYHCLLPMYARLSSGLLNNSGPSPEIAIRPFRRTKARSAIECMLDVLSTRIGSLPAELGDGAQNVAHDHGSKSTRLIEQQYFRTRHQPPTDGTHLLLAAAERAAQLLPALL